jgi:enoyl-CoA hydratase/carnithine racemase
VSATADPPLVDYACAERVAVLTLNRPDKLNAFSRALTQQLAAAMARFDRDGEADVAIFTGAGRAFSSGADVGESQMRSREELVAAPDPMSPGQPFADLLFPSTNWKPVIAAVHGYALGMALGLVLECDLIVAEEGARFQITEVPRGLGGYRHWVRLKARGAAALADEVSLTGRFFTSEEAYAAGVITRLAPKGEGLAAARELAAAIAANPPLGVRETVRVRRLCMRRLIEEVAKATENARLELTEDFEEAVRAFAEKRAPEQWKAR